MTEPFSLRATWLLFTLCMVLLSAVAGWVAHGVILH